MVMWAMSDRAIPRSFRMMEGFGVNTFRFINEEGQAHFVKFHWKPLLGVHSLVFDEAEKIGGKDPDFNRRDLWDSIEMGNYPEFELGVQLLAEKDEFAFDFDILDPTKLWPEEDVPVRIIGKMTLNRNVDNFFAETEQVAFHPGNMVPGIDFSNDPLLQGRLFSYLDTQLIRLGGPNFHELPINRPVCPFHNNQRDGYGRQTINVGQVAHHRNAMANNSPYPVSGQEGGYVHYQEKVEGQKIRARSDSFKNHFSQATLFWNSMSVPERQHIINAFAFEVGKVKDSSIRQRVADMFANVNLELAQAIAAKIGVAAPISGGSNVTKASPALSQENTIKTARTRKVAVLIAEGFDYPQVNAVIKALQSEGAQAFILSDMMGMVIGSDGNHLQATKSFITDSSVVFDAVYVDGGKNASPYFVMEACKFVKEAFTHYKPIAGTNEGKMWIKKEKMGNAPGVFLGQGNNDFINQFVQGIALHRFWDRILV